MKFLFLFHIISIVLFFSTTIWGDIVYLKDGKTIEGHFIESNDDWLTLDSFEKKIQIPVKNIKSVAMGFSGTNICIKIHSKATLDCTKQLHFISPRTVVILEGKGYMKAVKYSPSDFYSIQWKYQKNSTSIGKYIREGIVLKVYSKGSTIQGTFLRSEKGFIHILTQDQTTSIPEEEIDLLEINANSISSPTIISYMIPGLPQFISGDKVKGVSLMSFTALMGLGSLSEFQKAKTLAAQGTSGYKATSPEQVLFYHNINRNSQVNTHLKNSQIMAGIFTLIYIYHFLDLYYFSQDSEFTQEQSNRKINYNEYNVNSHLLNSFPQSIQRQFLISESQYLSWDLLF